MKLTRRGLLGGMLGAAVAVPVLAKRPPMMTSGYAQMEGMVYPPTTLTYTGQGLRAFRVDAVRFDAAVGQLMAMEVDATEVNGGRHRITFRTHIAEREVQRFNVGDFFHANVEALKNHNYVGTLPHPLTEKLYIEERWAHDRGRVKQFKQFWKDEAR